MTRAQDPRGATRAPVHATRRMGWCAAGGALLAFAVLTGCAGDGAQRQLGFAGSERMETAEATREFRVVTPTRAFANAPHSLLVLERDLGGVIEQRVALPNATAIAGENMLYLRAQTSGSASASRLRLTEILPRFGGAPAPFSDIAEGDLMVSEDRHGSVIYASRQLADGVVCVLAMRRADTGARPLPRGSVGLDMMLRNCVRGDVRDALRPIGEDAFGLGRPTGI